MNMTPEQIEKIVLPPEHERTIESIGEAAREKQIDYVGRGIVKERRDVFKEVLGERISAMKPAEPQGQTAVQRSDAEIQAERIKLVEKSKRLQELVNFAADKGPVEASVLVSKIGDPWLEDQFHDTIIKFHDELVRRKKLKEE